MITVNVSVRTLVEFILRSGDIDDRFRGTPADAMAKGGKIHRAIQARMGSDYTAEVPLSTEIPADGYVINISGRADGVIRSNDNSRVIIDEIKGVYSDVERMTEPFAIHLAQAECYAFILADNEGLKEISIRMTYCNMDTQNIRYFNSCYSYDEISKWFHELIDKYRKWAEFSIEWKKLRDTSIKAMNFPFEYRKGQKELASDVYRTIYLRKRLFLEAPTGVGKTSAVLFPAVKSVAEGIGGTIFYLTAKTVAGSVAEETYSLMRADGLRFKTVLITAREKMCLLDKPECNPEACPYAKGHFDRINDAIFELLNECDSYTRETVKAFAAGHRVCPFEMSLDMSLFSDGVICDYNYVFDPKVYLRRFFGDMSGRSDGSYIFLVDEAHNLVDRAREMYSARLVREDILDVRRSIKAHDAKLAKYLSSLGRQIKALEPDNGGYAVYEDISGVIMAAERAAGEFDEMLEDMKAPSDDILDFYFSLRAFVDISELLDDNYRIYCEINSDSRLVLKLFNVNPSVNLIKRLEKGRSAVFFSATILPVTYYMDLITGSREDYAVYARSTFDPESLGVFIERDVSSRYTKRGDDEYRRIASGIDAVVRARTGNYMIFFPSYSFMEEVFRIFRAYYADDDIRCIMQDRGMDEISKEDFLNYFIRNREDEVSVDGLINMDIETVDEKTIAGFCVLGGMFSEGIDLKEESLIGALIVGTGLPMVCTEREILKDYFDGHSMNGFDYAYRFPGMNKVLQAAGRVIRTENDRGVAVLMDERFASNDYSRLFPAEWKDIKYVNADNAGRAVSEFWESGNHQ